MERENVCDDLSQFRDKDESLTLTDAFSYLERGSDIRVGTPSSVKITSISPNLDTSIEISPVIPMKAHSTTTTTTTSSSTPKNRSRILYVDDPFSVSKELFLEE